MQIGPADLALTAAEAQQIFADVQLHLPAEQAAAVTARAEGWPVGLYLAAAIAAETGTITGALPPTPRRQATPDGRPDGLSLNHQT